MRSTDRIIAARAAATDDLRAALTAAADRKDAAVRAEAEARRDYNKLVVRVRDEQLLPVADIIAAARIKRSWLYQIKAGD